MRWPWWIAFFAVAALTLLAGYCLLRASRPRPVGSDAGAAPAIARPASPVAPPGPPDGGPAADPAR